MTITEFLIKSSKPLLFQYINHNAVLKVWIFWNKQEYNLNYRSFLYLKEVFKNRKGIEGKNDSAAKDEAASP